MNILRPVDVEYEIVKALQDYLTIYPRPLPENFSTPCILVTATGGTSSNEIDNFKVTLDARAETDEDAYDLIRTAQGLLEAQANNQFGALRHVMTNSLASWGTDPARPGLKLCTLTVLVIAHRELISITQNS